MLSGSNKLDNETIVLDKPCNFCKVLELDDALYGGEIKTRDNGAPFVDFGETVETKQDRIATSGLRMAKMLKALSYVMEDHDADAPTNVAKTELGLSCSRSDQLPDLQALDDTASTGCVFCKVLRDDLGSAWETIRENWGNEWELEQDNEDKKEIEEDMTKQEEEEDADAEESKDEQATVEVPDEKTEKTSQERGCKDEGKKEDTAKAEGSEQFQPLAVATEARPSKADLVITEMTYKLRDSRTADAHHQQTWLDALYVFFTIEYQGKERRYSIRYNIYAEKSGESTF